MMRDHPSAAPRARRGLPAVPNTPGSWGGLRGLRASLPSESSSKAPGTEGPSMPRPPPPRRPPAAGGKVPPLQFPATLLWQRGIRHGAGLPRVTAGSGAATTPRNPRPVPRLSTRAAQWPAEPQQGRCQPEGKGQQRRRRQQRRRSETSFGVLSCCHLPQTRPRMVVAKPHATRPRHGGASAPICRGL